MLPNYLNNIKSYGFIQRPIDFSCEIHSIVYLFNNTHIDLNDNYRVLDFLDKYGYLHYQQSENTFYLSGVCSCADILIHTDTIKCTISQEQYNIIITRRKALLQQIINHKIIKDMYKITTLILNKKLLQMKINKILYWI